MSLQGEARQKRGTMDKLDFPGVVLTRTAEVADCAQPAAAYSAVLSVVGGGVVRVRIS